MKSLVVKISLSLLFPLFFLAILSPGACPDVNCIKAEQTYNRLLKEYGEPDYTCVSNPIHGVIVDIWCCNQENRVVYYSTGYEYGCWESGYELYECESTELPEEVLLQLGEYPDGCSEIMNGGDPCSAK